MQNRKHFDDGFPSAPPFADSIQEIDLVGEQLPNYRAHSTHFSESLHGSGSANSDESKSSRSMHTGANNVHDASQNIYFDPSLRFVRKLTVKRDYVFSDPI